jgi:hypothetical protein
MNLWLGFKNRLNKENLIKVIILLFLLSLIIVIFWQKTELSSSDLGRHLENGRVVFSDSQVLFSNFYSYTEPSFRFINHHWLSGVIYYGIYLFSGFIGLHIFNILVILLTFIIFFSLAKKRSSFYITSLLSVPVIFLLSERVEVRPEMFSYLFLGLTWFILESKKFTLKKKAFLLFPLFALWANMHIYFFLGLILVFFWFVAKILDNTRLFNWKNFKTTVINFKKEIYLFISLVFASLISPNHVKGLLYPFNILREYGYQIAENKSIFYLDDLMLNYNFALFKLLFVLLLVSLLANYFLLQKKTYFAWFIGVLFSILALIMSRNISIFALFSLVLIAPSFHYAFQLVFNLANKFLLKNNFYNSKLILQIIFIILLSTSFIFLVTDLNRRQMFLRKDAGIGLTSGSLDVFDFYFQNNLQGPVFNNYDVGSALIFGFKGREKVFVDNRPEAYSVSFFQDTYIPMQESALVWQNRLAEYKFNTIIFAHTDSTPWAKQFLTSIPSDNKWALVYFDRYYVVLVNKDEYSASFISDYEIKIADFRYMIRQQAETKSLKGKFALASLAEIYNQPDLAKEIYRQIIFSYPYNSQALFGLGYLYSNSLERSDLLMALDYFYKGLKISPKTPGAYNQIGFIYWNLNDYSKAEKAWRQSLRVNRNDTARDYLTQIQDLRKKGDLP